jgi:hypothetical protein
MNTEPSPQMLMFDVTPKQAAPSARMIEEHSEPGSKRKDPLPSFLAAEMATGGAPLPCPSPATKSPANVPGPVLTPKEKRRLREQLAALGSPAAKRFLANVDPQGGGGHMKSRRFFALKDRSPSCV